MDIPLSGIAGTDYSQGIVTAEGTMDTRRLEQWASLLNSAGPVYVTATGSTTPRTLANRFADVVNVKDYGAIGDGVTDDTAAIQAAIDYAAIVVESHPANQDIVSGCVYFPAGRYNTTSPIILKNAVSIVGESSGSVELLISHLGNGFSSTSGQTYANVIISNLYVRNVSSNANGFHVYGFIRNCAFENVCVYGFVNNWYFQDTWTIRLQDCYSSTCASHVYCDSGCGAIYILGGRYDVSTSHGIYMNATAGEIEIFRAAIQSSSKSAVRTDLAYTAIIKDCFFEGNCINSATDYYIDLRSNAYTLSSAVVTGNVMNDLSDPTRYGLGCCNIDGWDYVEYSERWVRNGANAVPNIGASVGALKVSYNNAGSRTGVVTPITWNGTVMGQVDNTARPYGVYGTDFNATGTVDVKTRAALNVGLQDIGIAVGTHNQVPAIQGYGASFKVRINPDNGDVSIGNTDLCTVSAGTNEVRARFRDIAQVTSSNITPAATTGYVGVSCAAGNRTITLTNLPVLSGRRLMVGKTDNTVNTLTITPASGTISGAATLVLNTAYKHVELISDGTNWFTVG